MAQFPLRAPPFDRLLVFARVPELGRVKTRLALDLGSERALALYRAMLHDLLDSMGDAGGRFDLEVLWTAGETVNGATLREAFGGAQLARQTGETLGDRMSIAFAERIYFHRAKKIVAIGIDTPALDAPTVGNAFDLLESCDWVLGPSRDGGYYLIGCRAESYHPDVFRDVAWGTPEVLQVTVDTIRRLGETFAMLPERSDIDELRDLEALAPSLVSSGRVGAILRTMGWIP